MYFCDEGEKFLDSDANDRDFFLPFMEVNKVGCFQMDSAISTRHARDRERIC